MFDEAVYAIATRTNRIRTVGKLSPSAIMMLIQTLSGRVKRASMLRYAALITIPEDHENKTNGIYCHYCATHDLF